MKAVLHDPATGISDTEFINLESSTRTVLPYNPGAGEFTVIEQYTSPSYSEHTKQPHTLDGWLFITTK